MSIQKGPWEIDEWGNIVDADEHIIQLHGTILPDVNVENSRVTSWSNKNLIVNAPDLNHIVGKLLNIVDNPYANDGERAQRLFDLAEEMRLAYISEENYDE